MTDVFKIDPARHGAQTPMMGGRFCPLALPSSVQADPSAPAAPMLGRQRALGFRLKGARQEYLDTSTPVCSTSPELHRPPPPPVYLRARSYGRWAVRCNAGPACCNGGRFAATQGRHVATYARPRASSSSEIGEYSPSTRTYDTLPCAATQEFPVATRSVATGCTALYQCCTYAAMSQCTPCTRCVRWGRGLA